MYRYVYLDVICKQRRTSGGGEEFIREGSEKIRESNRVRKRKHHVSSDIYTSGSVWRKEISGREGQGVNRCREATPSKGQ